MTRDFEIIWSGVSQELGRKTVASADIDTALMAAWLDMPDRARAAGKPCSTITVRDIQSGHSITDDVVHHPPANRGIGGALMYFLAAVIVLVAALWMAKRGYMKGPMHDLGLHLFMMFPIFIISAIIYAVLGTDGPRKAAERWKKDFGDIAPPRPANPRGHRIVVATFSPVMGTLSSLFYLAVAAACIWYPLGERLHNGGWALWHPLLIGLGLVIAFIGTVPLRQLLFDGGAAIWIQGGAITYGHNRLWASRPILGLQDALVMRHRPENGIPYRAIVITSSNGDSQAIWTALMAQDAHDVAARLKSLLRLKGDLRAG